MRIRRPLTPRQQVILREVARGRTNKDIAAELGISEQGVKVHISRLLERYGAENRVELVNLTRAWPDPDEPGYAAASADIAGIRAGLNKTHQDATSLGRVRGGNGHLPARAVRTEATDPLAFPTSDLVAGVRSLREVLAEINIALKLAREMPSDANVGPIVDSIRARVEAALEQSAKLDALVDRARVLDRQTRRSAIQR